MNESKQKGSVGLCNQMIHLDGEDAAESQSRHVLKADHLSKHQLMMMYMLLNMLPEIFLLLLLCSFILMKA